MSSAASIPLMVHKVVMQEITTSKCVTAQIVWRNPQKMPSMDYPCRIGLYVFKPP